MVVLVVVVEVMVVGAVVVLVEVLVEAGGDHGECDAGHVSGWYSSQLDVCTRCPFVL